MTEISEIAVESEVAGRSGVATAYYDGGCPLCTAEVAALRKIANEAALVFVDCASPTFDERACVAEGVSRTAMLEAMHLRDSEGFWHRGADAIALIYRKAGLVALADLWSFPPLRALMRHVYPWIAANRQWLSRAGLPALTEQFIRFHARRAHRRARHCNDDNCSIN